MPRRGNITLDPGFVLPATGPITRADLMRVLTELVARVDINGVGDEEIADVSFAKLITGTLTGEKELIFSGEEVVAKSANYNENQRLFQDGVAVNGSTEFGSATANFTAADIGGHIFGDNIFGFATTIVEVVSATVVNLSEPASGSGNNGIFVMQDRPGGGLGWALLGNGQFRLYSGVFGGTIVSPGFSLGEDGSVTIGAGDNRMHATPDGRFHWGTGGAIIGITQDGEFFAGGIDFASAIFQVDSAGNLTLKNTAQSNHFINIGAIDLTISATQADPPGGAFSGTIAVALLCQTQGVKIYYTTDGSTPSASSTLYSGARINLSLTTTLKAIAIKLGEKSDVSEWTFTTGGAASNTVPNPTASPVGGSYSPSGGNLSVTLRDILAGSSIRYTTNGSTPSETDGTLISPPNINTIPSATISLATGPRTVKMIAFKTGMTNSQVVAHIYEITQGGAPPGGGGPGDGGGRGNPP